MTIMTNSEAKSRELALHLAHDSPDLGSATRVVARAEVYLAFLKGDTKWPS